MTRRSFWGWLFGAVAGMLGLSSQSKPQPRALPRYMMRSYTPLADDLYRAIPEDWQGKDLIKDGVLVRLLEERPGKDGYYLAAAQEIACVDGKSEFVDGETIMVRVTSDRDYKAAIQCLYAQEMRAWRERIDG